MRLVETLTAALVAAPFAIGTAVAGDPGDAEEAQVAFRFRDPQIVESSGLVVRDGLFVTVNDSGDSGRTFVVDPQDGRTVGGASWPREPSDVEAIAPTPDGSLLVGDIGDNVGSRESVTLVEVPFDRGFSEVDPATYTLTYRDGARDAETLMVHPRSGRVLVVSKELLGGALYAAPRRLRAGGPQVLEPAGSVIGLATDGAFFPDGRHFVLRDYGRAVVYTYPGLEAVGELELPDQQQGEGIAVDEDGRVFLSTEGQFSAVHRLRLPATLARVVGPAAAPPASAEPPATERPAAEGPAAATPDQPAAAAEPGRDAWPWLLGGLLGIGMVVVLIRSLRPR